VPAPSSLYAALLVIGGVVLVGLPSLIGLSQDLGLLFGVLLIGAGAALLVSRMRERATDDGDDGAVV
jgi:predicted Kef-type K+ transport protein